jgi:hypothetical protein
MQLRAHGYRNLVEQSERPEGPFIPEFRDIAEIHDFAGNRYRSIIEQTIYPEFKAASGIVADSSSAMRIFGTRTMAGNANMLATARQSLALSPERLLVTALDASDAHMQPQEILQSVPQDIVTFTLDDAPVRIFLNHYTHLPTAVDYSGAMARDGFWRTIGDVTMRTYYSYWWLGDDGLRLPMQWDIFRNGLPDSSIMIATLSLNAPIAEADMQISADIRTQFAKAAASGVGQNATLQPAVEVAPGVTLIPGSWNVLFVRQTDGLVILEAPISSAYSEQIITEAKRLYPDAPIKAVITTSDSWPHLAGVRAYVARQIPVYGLDINIPALTRLVKARFSSAPDALERSPRKAIFQPVSGKISIGSGANQIDLYQIRGETSERQMMAYFPNLHLLYGSDPFQQGQNGSFRTMQAVSELVDAVARERLDPERFVMMHVGITPWTELKKSLDEKTTFPDENTMSTAS